MTQKVFDVDNEEDMDLLWSILPDDVVKLSKNEPNTEYCVFIYSDSANFITKMLKINWHYKAEITRPIQECTEQDIGKLCAFWNRNINDVFYGELLKINERFNPHKYQVSGGCAFIHCRRLTKPEIEELI